MEQAVHPLPSDPGLLITEKEVGMDRQSVSGGSTPIGPGEGNYHMNESSNDESSRLAPEAMFPEDLTLLNISEVAVLNSRVHRAMDAEYIEFGTADPETEARLAELTEELDRRDESTSSRKAPAPLAEDTALGL